MIFKLAILVLQGVFIVTKYRLTKKYIPEHQEMNYPNYIKLLLAMSSIFMILPIFIITGWVDRFVVVLPLWLRIGGILGLTLTIWLVKWQMDTLGVNINMIHEDRSLITSGPYRYIRHPLYMIFVLVMFFDFFISANYLFIIGTLILFITGYLRGTYEEQILLKEYGDEYMEYMKNTGRLIPKLFLKAHSELPKFVVCFDLSRNTFLNN